MLKEYLKNIADAIRAKLGTTDTINARDFTTKIDEVYDAGKVAREQEFWDYYMGFGNNYSYSFSGGRWYADNFNPTKDIMPTSAEYMFASFGYSNKLASSDFDLVEHLDELGVTLDFSKCTTLHQTFHWARIKHIGVVDLTAAKDQIYSVFAGPYIKKIDEIIVNANNKYNTTMSDATGLEEIRFTGTIGQSGLSLGKAPKLSKASIISVINALSDETSTKTVTLSKTAVNNAFGTSTGAADGSKSEEWATLIATKPNWTISLA